MGKLCSSCGKKLTFRNSFIYKDNPVCKACLNIGLKVDNKLSEEEKLIDEVDLPQSEKQIILEKGFHFGAFALAPIWLILHGRMYEAIGIIVLNILLAISNLYEPSVIYLTLFIDTVIGINYGLNGWRIALMQENYLSYEHLIEKETKWIAWGTVAFLSSIFIFFLILIWAA